MSKKTITIAASIVLGILIVASVGQVAFAYPASLDGKTGLDELLDQAKDRVQIVEENPGTGSGTPMFAADGILGATTLSVGVFGGIATAFFVMSRKGKYAAMGRG